MPDQRAFLTNPPDFRDVSRGNPKPHTLKGEPLVQARLTPETWRLEIVGDGSTQIANPPACSRQRPRPAHSGEIGQQHGVKFLKAMQCLNIAQPLGQGLWEGVPLREVLKLAGKISNVRRVYYWGFHNNDPKQLFQSSLQLQPGDGDAAVGACGRSSPIGSTARRSRWSAAGRCAWSCPWAHGFKSIKWLQRIMLTNDYKANDTYARQQRPRVVSEDGRLHRPGAQAFEAGSRS